MTTAAILLATVIGGGLALLTARVTVELDLECERTWRAQGRVRWLGGLVDVRRSSDSAAARPPPPRRAPAPAREPGAHEGEARPHRVTARRRVPTRRLVLFLTTPGLGSRLFCLIGDVKRSVTVDRLYADGEFGLDDPADTGTVYGFMSPFVVGANVAGFDLRVQPIFDEASLRGRCGGSVGFRPIRLAWACGRFAISPPMLRGLGRFAGGRA